MTRRDLLKYGSLAMLPKFDFPLALSPGNRKSLKFAVITDLHHGLAPDAMMRVTAFIEAVKKRKDLACVLQLGDFCYSDAGSQELLDKFNEIKIPKIHVLGNHDMDKCSKTQAMKRIGMEKPYQIQDFGDYRFVVLDLNHFLKGNQLVSYDNGNYFTDNASHNWIDDGQMAWLENVLNASPKPVILLSHQPLGFAEPGHELPAEQKPIVDLVSEKALKKMQKEQLHCHCLDICMSTDWNELKEFRTTALIRRATFGLQECGRIRSLCSRLWRSQPMGD